MIWKQEGNLILVRMEDGEDFFEKLKELSEKIGIKGAIILSGVGQFREVELAYYSKAEKKYYTKKFDEIFEILHLDGNLGFFENELVIHVHTVLGNKNLECVGGHLNKAKVNSTLELAILRTESDFKRKLDETTGLKLLNFG